MFEHGSQTREPHYLQWCFRLMMVNFLVQIPQVFWKELGVHLAAGRHMVELLVCSCTC